MRLSLLLLAGCVIDAKHHSEIADAIATGDRDGDGYEDATEGGDDCDDLDAAIHPGADETWEDGVTDNDCDGEREAVQTEFGAVSTYGESEGAWAGNAVLDMPDIDGDGLGEILVGAFQDSSRYDLGGAVYLVSEPNGGSLGDYPAIRPQGESWYLGNSMDGGLDYDGDGVADLVITSLGYGAYTGAVWLVSGVDLAGGSLEMPDAAIASIQGDKPGDEAGSCVRFIGDVDGDGITDLAVSDQLLAAGGFENAGAVGIFQARDLGDAAFSDADVIVYGTYAGAYLGSRVMSAGDQDGDGIDDYMISAVDGLQAIIMPGGVSHPTVEDDAIFTLSASGADREAGEARMIGDVDGDGALDLAMILAFVNDIAVAPTVLLYTSISTNPNRVTSSANVKIEIGEDAYAYDAASLGDLDGDGRDELLVPVGVYQQLDTSVFAVHFGDTLDFNADIDVLDTPLTGVSVTPSAGYGYRVSVGLDVDGDGLRDIVFGGPGYALNYDHAGAITTVPVPQ